jgi:glucose/arabinose dehydrogenase
MKKGLPAISVCFLLLINLSSCNSGNSVDKNPISSDSAVISKGKNAFTQYCSGCHNFRQDGIGPQLGGLTSVVSPDWIQHFVQNPKIIIESGDQRARELFKKYKVLMPGFPTLKDDTMVAIIAYLNTHKKIPRVQAKTNEKELSNPIPQPIKLSNLVVGLKLLTQIPSSSDSGKLPLTRITKLGYEPHTGTPFILDLRGKLYKMLHGKPLVYMDMAKLKPKFVHEPGLATGFGSFAFHPDFSKNGLLYTTHSEAAGSAKADYGYADSIKVTVQWVLTEWKANKPDAAEFSGKGRELLRVNMVSGIHGVQEISFNQHSKPNDKDYGLLYIGIGDGGAVEEGYPFLAHSREKVWGTILRIDPRGSNSLNGQYGIPKNNPFSISQNPATIGEIYAYGFRNPHRMSWSKSGQMLVCNIGQHNIESVNLVMPGRDYGWPIREGSFVLNPNGDLNKVYPLPKNDSIYNITYPIAQYDHDEGKAICGGFEYEGKAIPQLAGKYLFGDIPTGRLFYINMADAIQGKQAPIREWRISIKGIQMSLARLCGTDRIDLHFGKDSHGELYILTKPDGKVYKLASAKMLP